MKINIQFPSNNHCRGFIIHYLRAKLLALLLDHLENLASLVVLSVFQD